MDLELEKDSIYKKVEDKEYWMCLMELESLGKPCEAAREAGRGQAT